MAQSRTRPIGFVIHSVRVIIKIYIVLIGPKERFHVTKTDPDPL